MPLVDKPLADLKEYYGISPRPSDFNEYWDAALTELDATDPAPKLERSKEIDPRNAEAFDLWFTGVGGARIYAKYLRPKKREGKLPAILHFHGYTGNSGEWADKLNYVGEGFVAAALDCRGQGGKSEDSGAVKGNTHHGHIIRGLDDAPEKLLFRSIFLDTAQLARVIMSFEEVDASRVATFGGSQGGALSLVCAALEPRIKKCVSVFPFLSDYRRIWEMDLYKDAYAELRTFFRHFDPLHEREDEIFNKLGYIDIKNLTPRIKADVLMAITLMDTICPPSTQFAAFNNISAKKESIVYPDYGHEGLPQFGDKAFGFLRDL
ncbi:cephalosporin-C deacetylase [Terrimicrobium sacchariphilum]|uniref:Cephalosporin-C deacetylase n=1 Tax=Terrimicrobium sacchariphilum TaxID=690879 RepID=A0A146GC94_TERSA|nr:alpha/beta fold hydrolase [Terrimicrobium sacchariphilum]GAT34178.1 cephalosporin-C deacetylase [Terrimicrobium sacchariphilum]